MDDRILPPYYAVSADNHAAWVVATSIIFLIYSAFAVGGKIVLRFNVTFVKLPDICLIGALLILVVQTALIIVACNNGLGQHTPSLVPASFETESKYYYAASILAILVQCLTKISTCLWIGIINPYEKVKIANYILMSLTGAWTVSGLFALAFACGLPHPWRATEGGVCTPFESIQIYNGVLNILTDLAICILPVFMMWRVQTSMRKKSAVCALFASRILCPAFTIPALASSGSYYDNLATDPTWFAVSPTILGQISLNLSVLTACVPGMKSILETLLAGVMRARIEGGYNLTSTGDKRSPFKVTIDGGGQANSHASQSRTRTHLSMKIADKLGFRRDVSHHELSRSQNRITSESERNLTDAGITKSEHWEVSMVNRNSSSDTHQSSRQHLFDPRFATRVSTEDAGTASTVDRP